MVSEHILCIFSLWKVLEISACISSFPWSLRSKTRKGSRALPSLAVLTFQMAVGVALLPASVAGMAGVGVRPTVEGCQDSSRQQLLSMPSERQSVLSRQFAWTDPTQLLLFSQV